MNKTIMTIGIALLSSVALVQAEDNFLESCFINPPDSSKPHTWYHWMNGHISKEGITKDLDAMKKVGIGGFQHFDVGRTSQNGSAGPVSYGSQEWLELVSHLATESEKREIQHGFHNCPGWSSTAGPWVTPEMSMKMVVWSEVDVTAQTRQPLLLAEPLPSKKLKFKKMNQLKHALDVKNRFYADIALLAFPKIEQPFELENIHQKALNLPFNYQITDFAPDTRQAPAGSVVPGSRIIDITEHLQPDGTLNWKPESGTWTVLRFGYCSNGRVNQSPPNGGMGFEIDKLDPAATDFFWRTFLDKVLDASGGSIREILIDSYEAGVQNWTRGFEEEFQERNGYNLISYLPVFAGYTVDDVDTTERVLWDLRNTVKNMMQENYFGRFKQECEKRGILLATEPYNTGSFDSAEVARMSDVPMGEFWEKEKADWNWTCKIAASGAHHSGRHVVGAESFTSMWGRFYSAPKDMKSGFDNAYTLGINRLVFHTYAHQPFDDAFKPGMTMHRYGTNFHRNNTWFLEAGEFFRYQARCQHILQSGTYMADVLYLYGEEHGFNNLKGSAFDFSLDGYNYDISSIALLEDLEAEANGDVRVRYEGKLLDSRYKVIVLYHADLMRAGNVEMLGKLASRGVTILAPRPSRSPSLINAEEEDKKLGELNAKYWDTGLIKNPDELQDVLSKIPADCESDLADKFRFCRTEIGDSQFYFVTSREEMGHEHLLTFRVAGMVPEIWDPMDGSIKPVNSWKVLDDQRTQLKLNLEKDGSRFVVFRKKTDRKDAKGPRFQSSEILKIAAPWTLNFDPEWGPKDPVILNTLIPWNEHAEDAIKYYSGKADYRTEFVVPKSALEGDVSVIQLCLGEVEDMASIRVNGTSFPVKWHAPYRFDISDAIHAGRNTLEVRVTNTWKNRLIGDQKKHPLTFGIPDWVLNGVAPPDDYNRKTWVYFNHAKAGDLLDPAGLIGPVRLLKSSKLNP